jgi:SAM-dependent methyltransferase
VTGRAEGIDAVAAMAAVLDAIQTSFRDRMASGISTLTGRPESWGFVPAPTAYVVDQLRVAWSRTPARSPRFLECGSGFGFVAALAREVGFSVTGIEIEPSYVEISRGLFPSVRVEEADLTTFDRFGDFDVIYYYKPFAEEDRQARFERRVEAALRPGGIVLAIHKVSDDWRRDGAFTLLSTDGARSFVLQKSPR